MYIYIYIYIYLKYRVGVMINAHIKHLPSFCTYDMITCNLYAESVVTKANNGPLYPSSFPA